MSIGRSYNCKCPVCGHKNEFLYLDETEGWMECEECQSVVQTKYLKRTVNIPIYDLSEITELMKKEILMDSGM